MHSDLLLVIVVGVALAFDFTNGFHDTANVVASSISTRALSPRTAVTLAAGLNFIGAVISLKVAATIATGFLVSSQVTLTVMFAGLVGAICWNLATWAYGMPASSSHALIGGVVGAMLAAAGTGGVHGAAVLNKLLAPAVLAPVTAFFISYVLIRVIYAVVASRRPGAVKQTLRSGQIVAGSLLALSHGTNDAQKTMGVITLALVAHGDLSASHPHTPLWVVLSTASVIALGTYAGGWRIIRTLGTRIIKMDSAQGFSAQSGGAAVILVSSHFGYPLSTTQVIAGGVMGAGAAKRFSAVRWGVAENIAAAWLLTVPAAGLVGAVVYGVSRIFGSGALGPVLILALVVSGLAALTARRMQTA